MSPHTPEKALLVALVLLLAGCTAPGSSVPAPVATAVPTPSPTPTPTNGWIIQ